MSKENIEKLESALGRLETKENVIYFLTYDTKNNARASVKHIYDMALTLKENGSNPKILIEDNWKQCDVWITDNKKIIDLIPENKTGIKFNTTYNQFFTYKKEITKLTEIQEPWLKFLENPTTLTLTESQKNVEQEEQSQTKTEQK